MENNGDEFNRALSRMAYETTGKRAIRHLFDSGLSPEEIEAALTYPRPLSVIEKEIEEYKKEKERGESKAEYVLEQDAYGRISYIRKN